MTAKQLAPQPPSLRRLLAEKFEGAEEWFTQGFLPAFNAFATDVSNSLQRTIAEEREIVFTTEAGSVTADNKPFPIFIKPQFLSSVRRVTISCPCVNDGFLPLGACDVQWRPASDGRVEIRFINGITAGGYTYKMRLLLEP